MTYGDPWWSRKLGHGFHLYAIPPESTMLWIYCHGKWWNQSGCAGSLHQNATELEKKENKIRFGDHAGTWEVFLKHTVAQQYRRSVSWAIARPSTMREMSTWCYLAKTSWLAVVELDLYRPYSRKKHLPFQAIQDWFVPWILTQWTSASVGSNIFCLLFQSIPLGMAGNCVT